MKRHVFDVNLHIRAPFMFPGIAAGRYGVDKVAMRNKAGEFVLPQDQLRGVILDSAKELVGEGDPRITDLFGAKSGDALAVEGRNFAPQPTRIFFEDLTATIPRDQSPKGAYHRVRVDEESGAAAEGQLMMLEQAAAPGAVVHFSGQIVVYTTDDELGWVTTLLSRCTDLPITIGAYATIGFGQIDRIADKKIISPATVKPIEHGLVAGDRIAWTFMPDRPYLVDAKRIENNAYVGSVAIPGGALKGCLARNVELRGYDIADAGLSAALSALRVGFAQPQNQARIPFSIVELGQEDPERMDMLAGALNGANEVPTFQTNWKGDSNSTEYDERVHTAISGATGAPVDKSLYSTLAVVPEKPGLAATLDFTDVPAEFERLFKDIIGSGLDGLGRTNAHLKTIASSESPQPPAIGPGIINLLVTTPGLLAAYDDGEDARSAYRNFWKDILPNSELKDFYATQSLRGGYQSRRFRLQDEKYRNWLLTDPGSVFAIDVDATDIDALNRLLASGLNRASVEGEALDWQNCPFVSTNGYGTFAIHKTGDLGQNSGDAS